MGNLELRIMCACIAHSIVGSDLNRYHYPLYYPHYTMLLCQIQARVVQNHKATSQLYRKNVPLLHASTLRPYHCTWQAFPH